MQLTRFYEIQNRLIKDLRLAEIRAHLENILYTGNPAVGLIGIAGPLTTELFKAREALSGLLSVSDLAEVAHASGLLDLFSVDYTSKMIVALQTKSQLLHIRAEHDLLARFAKFFWTVSSFISQHRSLTEAVIIPRNREKSDAKETVLFEIFDLDKDGFNPSRVARALADIENLFETVGSAYDIEDRSVRIAYFDSGSGLILALTAAAGLVTVVRKLLTDLLPVIRDWKTDSLNKQLDVANKTVDLCQRLSELEATAKLTHEEAARTKHLVLSAVSDLVSHGAFLREIKNDTVDYRARLLEASTVKAIAGPRGQELPRIEAPKNEN